MKNEHKLPETVLTFIDECLRRTHAESYLIPVLQRVQNHFGFLPKSCLDEVAWRMKVPYVKVTGVATFYHFFSFEPRGKNRITVCMGTACYVRGAEKVLSRFREVLGLSKGRNMTDDGEFSIECARCLGACALAPVVVVNDRVHAGVKPDDVPGIIKAIRSGKAGGVSARKA